MAYPMERSAKHLAPEARFNPVIQVGAPTTPGTHSPVTLRCDQSVGVVSLPDWTSPSERLARDAAITQVTLENIRVTASFIGLEPEV